MLRAAIRQTKLLSTTRPLRAVSRLPVVSSSVCLSYPNTRTSRPLASAAAVQMTSAVKAQHVQPDVYHESIGAKTPAVFSFFEKVTDTWQYIIADPQTHQAAIVDPVLDYDPASGTVSTKSADELLSFVKERGLNVTHILETHAHADHLTSSRYLKAHLPNKPSIGIGARITQVQKTFAPIYGYDDPGIFNNAFDVYWKDDEEFKVGDYVCRVVHLPGHTPDHVGYVFGSAIFTGDSIFNPDVGSARSDFPGGNAKDLFNSMQRLLALPHDSRLFVGHDYPPGARLPTTSVAVRDHHTVWKDMNEGEFVQWREARDATLGAPRLLHPSLQVNILGGRLPPKDDCGRLWFKTPVRAPQWPAAED